MTPALARRVYLATMPASSFAFVFSETAPTASGLPSAAGYGFTRAEVVQGKADRRAIRDRYRAEFKRGLPFLDSEIRAKVEWLESLETETEEPS